MPTRALIKQYVTDLNKEINKLQLKNYKVVTNANILDFIDVNRNKFIFVLTQERLNVLLYNKNRINLNYLIVDEAYKTYDESVRGLTLYSTINTCLMKFKDLKIVFASPLINNPDIFKNTFKESMKSFNFRETPVTQNLFYIDLKEQIVEKIQDMENEDIIRIENYTSDKNELYYKLGVDSSNIIYLSGQAKAIEYSNEFLEYISINNIELLTNEDKKEVDNLCELIKKSIHKDFFLIEALKKGIAYHYGKLPSIVRESIETLFKEGVIKYLFCTSTLLEGVNLPAKNIFIMADYNGNSKMQPLEFWNLAGRAGRLGYEYYGNVFCVKDYNHKNAWKEKGILYTKKNIEVKDKLEEKIKKEKKKISVNLSTNNIVEDLNKKDKYINYLSNIIEIDKLSKNQTLILEKVKKVDFKLLEKDNHQDIFDYNLVNSNKTIDYKIQCNIYNQDELPIIKTINYENCLEILVFMYKYYRWDIKESRLKSRNSLKYIAFLMNSWIKGLPLNEMIEKSINYYDNKKRKIKINHNYYELFDSSNSKHINILINDIIANIEEILRFDLEKYFNHYYNLLELKYG